MDDEQPTRRSRRHDGKDAWSLKAAENGFGGEIAVGDLVQLVFVRQSADAQGSEEALWVRVVGVGDEVVEGELDNQPTWIRGLSDGDPVTFGRAMVHKAMSGAR